MNQKDFYLEELVKNNLDDIMESDSYRCQEAQTLFSNHHFCFQQYTILHVTEYEVDNTIFQS